MRSNNCIRREPPTLGKRRESLKNMILHLGSELLSGSIPDLSLRGKTQITRVPDSISIFDGANCYIRTFLCDPNAKD